MEPTKICSECAAEKPLSDFYFRKDSQKHRNVCTACHGLGCKLRHKQNIERDNELSRLWRLQNPERAAQLARRWYAENKECHAATRTARKKKGGVTIEKERLANNLRTRCIHALKGAYKVATTMKLLGCSVDFLREHLEKQFLPGMSWENYGRAGWHMDHIKPCDSFSDLSDPAQQRECFHFSNLQPLWAIDNIKKGNKNA